MEMSKSINDLKRDEILNLIVDGSVRTYLPASLTEREGVFTSANEVAEKITLDINEDAGQGRIEDIDSNMFKNITATPRDLGRVQSYMIVLAHLALAKEPSVVTSEIMAAGLESLNKQIAKIVHYKLQNALVAGASLSVTSANALFNRITAIIDSTSSVRGEYNPASFRVILPANIQLKLSGLTASVQGYLNELQVFIDLMNTLGVDFIFDQIATQVLVFDSTALMLYRASEPKFTFVGYEFQGSDSQQGKYLIEGRTHDLMKLKDVAGGTFPVTFQ